MLNENNIIVIVTPSLGAGGIERVVSKLATFLDKVDNIEVKIICFGKKEIFYPVPDSVEIFMLKSSKVPGVNLFLKLFMLRKWLSRLKPKAMICFGSMYNSFFLFASFGIQGKKFVSDRSNPWRNSRFTFRRGGTERHDGLHHFLLKRLLYPTAHKILTQTKLSCQIEAKAFGADKVLYFPNPIDDVSLNNTSKEKIILNVGRFVESKGQADLIRIFAELSPDYRNEWRLVFLGGGDQYYDHCKALAKELGITQQVDFIGFEKDVQRWYSKAEVFAFTSYSEGFPNALAEAMSWGNACIAYDCEAGPSDLIESDKNGFLIPVGNYNAFKIRLEWLLKHSSERKRIQKESLAISEKYSAEKSIKRLVDEIL